LNKFLKSDILALIIIVAISIAYWFGATSVPFHPDESTQLYMAADFRTIFTNPSSLIWRQQPETNLRMHYREIDPPFSRYLIGFGLMIVGQKPLDQDWDWSKSFQANSQAGVLPNTNQLFAGRLAVAALFPFSLVCAYYLGKKLHSPGLGWLSFGLIAINSLVLIHTRRAMAESGLLFGVLLSLLGAVAWRRQRFWLALPAALAFNAKYTALPLALIGLIAVVWDYQNQITPWKKKIVNAVIYCTLFLAVTFALNPFLWNSPIQALKDAAVERDTLLERQREEIGQANSSQSLNTIGQRGVAILSQVFIAPPASEDVGNYTIDLQKSITKYTSNPMHVFMRGWMGGSVILCLTLAGLIFFIFWLIRKKPISRSGILILGAFLLQITAILIAIQLPFQRYYIPLIPFTSIFLAFSLLYPLEYLLKRITAVRK